MMGAYEGKETTTSWARRTLAEIERDSFRQEPTTRTPEVAETAWAIGTLSDEAVDRLATFIDSLTRRAPLAGPAWSAHRVVLEALVSDLRREQTRREGEDE